MEFDGRRAVADDPVDFLPVFVDDELGRSAADVVSFVDGVAERISPAGAVDDEVFVQEFGVIGVFVELLDQQFTAPSTVGVEIDEDGFVFLLGQSQCFLERSLVNRGRLGRSQGCREDNSGKNGEFSHSGLLY